MNDLIGGGYLLFSLPSFLCIRNMLLDAFGLREKALRAIKNIRKEKNIRFL